MTAAALLAAALAATASDASTEPPRARPLSFMARTSRTEARLGEPFAYEIEVRHRPDESYSLAPELEAPPFRGRGGECRRSEDGGEAQTACTLTLALFDLGPHDVPEIRLSVRTAAGEATLAVPGPRITGVGIVDPGAPPETLALRDLAPPVALMIPTLRLVWWTLGAAAAVAAALAASRRLRAGRARSVRTPPPVAPGERLARRLDALEARALPARGLAREFFFELSAIVREWVGAVTGVNALDLTTAELVERLERAGDPRIDAAALRRFCEAADLVKFAREAADPSRCAAALAWARALDVPQAGDGP